MCTHLLTYKLVKDRIVDELANARLDWEDVTQVNMNNEIEEKEVWSMEETFR